MTGLLSRAQSFSGQTVSHADLPGTLVLNGLMAEYRFDEAVSGPSSKPISLTDRSGNHLDGEVDYSRGQPKWSKDGLTWSSKPTGKVRLPPALNAARTIQVFARFVEGVPGQVPTLFGHTDATGPALIFNASHGNRVTIYQNATYSYGADTLLTTPSGINQLYSFVIEPKLPVMYVGDTRSLLRAPAFNSPVTGNYLLGASENGPNCKVGGSCSMSGTVYYAIFYNRALSAEEVAENNSYVKRQLAQRGVILANPAPISGAGNQLVVDGDSLALGAGAKHPYSWYLGHPSELLKYDYKITNLAVSGATVSDILVGSGRDSALYLDPKAALNVSVLWAGTNDVCTDGARPEQVANSIRKFVQGRKAGGWKVVVATMLSAKRRATCDPQKNALNTILRSTWENMGADAIADLAAAPLVGADGAYLNTAGCTIGGNNIGAADVRGCFIADNVHILDVAQQNIIAPIVAAVVNSLIPMQPHPAKEVSSAYQMQTSDHEVRAAADSGPFTVVLPDCVGITGMKFHVANGGKRNIVTLIPSSSTKYLASATETIDGRGSLQLGPDQQAQLVSMLGTQGEAVDQASSGGNCHWKIGN